jgi:hypothetical protein
VPKCLITLTSWPLAASPGCVFQLDSILSPRVFSWSSLHVTNLQRLRSSRVLQLHIGRTVWLGRSPRYKVPFFNTLKIVAVFLQPVVLVQIKILFLCSDLKPSECCIWGLHELCHWVRALPDHSFGQNGHIITRSGGTNLLQLLCQPEIVKNSGSA